MENRKLKKEREKKKIKITMDIRTTGVIEEMFNNNTK